MISYNIMFSVSRKSQKKWLPCRISPSSPIPSLNPPHLRSIPNPLSDPSSGAQSFQLQKLVIQIIPSRCLSCQSTVFVLAHGIGTHMKEYTQITYGRSMSHMAACIIYIYWMVLKALHDRLSKLGPKYCFNLQTLFQTLFQTYSCVRKTMSEYVVYGNHIVVYGKQIVVYRNI